MYLVKRVLFLFIAILIVNPILFSQEIPKKPTKITEESVNQICNEVINNALNEERPKLLNETKKIVEEAIKSAQEENKKTLE